MHRVRWVLLSVVVALGIAAAVRSARIHSVGPTERDAPAAPAIEKDERAGRQAPEFTRRDPKDWINSAPLRMHDLRGRVVLLDVWTFT